MDTVLPGEGAVSSIKELAERALRPRTPFADADHEVNLLLGQVPEGLLDNLPDHPNSRLLGSVVRKTGDRVESIEVLLENTGDLDAVLSFYESGLGALGWMQTPIPRPMAGGFTRDVFAGVRWFRRDEAGPTISASVSSIGRGRIDTRISIEYRRAAPFAQPIGSRAALQELPMLRAPADVPLQPQGGGGLGTGSWSEAIAITDLPAQALEAHFGQQFLESGWQQVDRGADGPLAWSTWRKSIDEQSTRVLLVIETAADQRVCHARAAAGHSPNS